MSLTCPTVKVERLQKEARVCLEFGSVTVHSMEKLLGLMESVWPATPLAALHYCSVQKLLLKTKATG